MTALRTARAQRACLLSLLLALTTACDSDGSSSDPEVESPRIRIANLLPDAPTMSIQLDESFLANVSFGQASPIVSIPADSYELDAEYDLPDGSTEVLIDDEPLTFMDEREYTGALLGPLEAPTLLVIDTALAEPPAGTAEVVFMNGATDATSLEFHLTPADAAFGSEAPDVTLAFGSASEVRSVDSGSYRLRLAREGESEVLFDSGPFDLAALTRRTLVALDYFGPGDTPIRAVRLDTASASPFPEEVLPSGVTLVNLIADATVDVSLTGPRTITASALEYGTIATEAELPAGQYALTISRSGEPDSVLHEDVLQFVAGERRDLVLAGLSRDDSVLHRLALKSERASPPSPGWTW